MSKELCNWLRDNSSGAYRQSSEAADLIEAQAKEIDEMKLSSDTYFIERNSARDAVMRKNKQIAELRDALVEASGAIELLYAWANNWDSEFMNDPDWKHHDVQVIQEALTRCKELIK